LCAKPGEGISLEAGWDEAECVRKRLLAGVEVPDFPVGVTAGVLGDLDQAELAQHHVCLVSVTADAEPQQAALCGDAEFLVPDGVMAGCHHEDEHQLGVFQDVDPPVGEQRGRDREGGFPERDRDLVAQLGPCARRPSS
jgi:hypothetical protein